jgi:Flp pilus assembly protein TadG
VRTSASAVGSGAATARMGTSSTATQMGTSSAPARTLGTAATVNCPTDRTEQMLMVLILIATAVGAYLVGTQAESSRAQGVGAAARLPILRWHPPRCY